MRRINITRFPITGLELFEDAAFSLGLLVLEELLAVLYLTAAEGFGDCRMPRLASVSTPFPSK